MERKSLVDVANSMHDGRWEKQKAAMKRAQVLLGGGRRQCELIYLIEVRYIVLYCTVRVLYLNMKYIAVYVWLERLRIQPSYDKSTY